MSRRVWHKGGLSMSQKGVKRVAEEGMAQLGVKHVTQGSDCVSKEDVTMEETSCHKGRQNMLRSRASRRGVQHVTGHFLQESGMSQGTSAGTSWLHAGRKPCCQTRLAPGGGYYTSPGTLHITQHFLHKPSFGSFGSILAGSPSMVGISEEIHQWRLLPNQSSRVQVIQYQRKEHVSFSCTGNVRWV